MDSKNYVYKCRLRRVIDGDTVVCDVNLGFDVVLVNQKIRFKGINTPESRTRNLAEKALGLQAKARVKELVQKDFEMKTFKDKKGKFGRILGVPLTEKGESVCEILVKEGHARWYDGGKRESWI
jgi:micrococcal nuclease|tara:strand:- start:7248 stop:7619 length:372 start_codon:yes stop_codon:yes gene_type:complete